MEAAMRKVAALTLLVIWVVFSTRIAAEAHFGMIIPSDEMVMEGESSEIRLQLMFWHPFSGEGMELEKPARFRVVANGEERDLLTMLRSHKLAGHTTWNADYRVKRPGVYVFYMEPRPYWEPAEDCYIVHYTKTVVAAYGKDQGWDEAIGLETEIVPLTRPFGLYAGNAFQGVVIRHGESVPHAEVEVEYFNEDGTCSAPTDYMVTQTIKADPNGVFTYAVPRAGWWGFAALGTDTRQIKGKDVEIGAVLWVNFHEMR
jgi:cobalt/nickel transport protein